MGFKDLLLFYRHQPPLDHLCSGGWDAFDHFLGHSPSVVYIPLVVCLLEPLSRHPQEGGLYQWSHRAFGDFAGFMTGLFQDRQEQCHPFGPLDSEVLTRRFQHHVLQRLTSQRRLSREFADRLRCWHPSGFQVSCGPAVDRDDQPALKRLSASILRPCFAGTRLQYDADNGQVEYRTTKGLIRRMDALDWIALVTSHIPDPHQQMARHYGCYSNASRGKRRKQTVSALLNTGLGSAPQPHPAAPRFACQRRCNWARLLKKIYEAEPLRCPRCGNRMEIIAFIEGWAVIRKILQHLGLWERPPRAPPPALLPHKLEAFLATLSPPKRRQVPASTDAVFWDDVPVYRG